MTDNAHFRSRDVATSGAAIGAVGVALTAALATLCCVGPAVVAIVGVGGAVAAASLEPYRPYLLALSFGMLGLAFWRAYVSKPRSADGVVCTTRSGRGTRVILWSALVVTLGSLLLPTLGVN